MMDKKEVKNLKKRYLVWFYKNTKESLDKIERKFTQVEVDRFILKELKARVRDGSSAKFIRQFEEYIEKKERDGLGLKFEDKKLKPDYLFIVAKLRAIEKAIVKELGRKALEEIKLLYEIEMTERILGSREH
ncbi:MAG: hypothetical protein PHP89_01650 [Candidatus Omnitrophica bacterium]|jgi:hypothetical protein|nr:hypothetical protein [Candidatus Omnitrophota bacterium]MDD3987353.1 hypothetical protein [Candidatus Omnitrophota bacterium]MDD4981602.1 hypothetical protein [Candidatus Omnitrophota bacterium]MDD5664988.1 hypothetical protein [Candidatus Omnitrophota bacterium]